MPPKEVQIDDSWKKRLEDAFSEPYFESIKSYLIKAKQDGKVIYPPGPLIFNAFNQTPFDKVKVVILGQDPYHGPGQAMGLSFSVHRGVSVPASLKNIFKELQNDIGCTPVHHGDLSSWSRQGVFLLNAVLTVEHKRPGSHKHIGWQQFTDQVIRTLSADKEHLVFLLWGNYAKNKASLIDKNKHDVLTAPHPSPLARGGFFGHHHFSKTNQLLINHGQTPIDWQIPNASQF